MFSHTLQDLNKFALVQVYKRINNAFGHNIYSVQYASTMAMASSKTVKLKGDLSPLIWYE